MPFLRDCAAAAAAVAESSRVYDADSGARDEEGLSIEVGAVDGCVRCDDVRGGGIGPPLAMEVEVAGTTGDEWVEGGRGCARGVFMAEFVATAGEWYVCGVVGV